LKETLEQLLPQMEAGTETVIVDGGSQDSTAEVVSELKESWPNIAYIRRQEPGGVDRDFALAVEAATGEYCWLMSDDDVLRPGAVHAVLERLDQGFSLLVVNAEVRNADLTEMIDRRRLPFEHDRTYGPEELDRLLAEAGSFLSFIGCVVIRRDLWCERERESYIGSEFIHVGVIFQAPLPGRALAIAQPWIVIRYGNAQWGPRSFRIWMFQWPSLIWSFSHIAEWAKKSVVVRAPWRRTKTLLRYRATGAYTPQVYRTMIRPVAASFGMRARAWAVAYLPGMLANVMGLVYYRWFHPSSNLELADMRSSHFYPFRSLTPGEAGRAGRDRQGPS
jgi:glycosyltransferase involved in cell wall biosynthesis